MKHPVLRVVLVVLAFLSGTLSAHSVDSLSYIRLYTDSDGVSRFSEGVMPWQPWQRTRSGGGTTQALARLAMDATELRFVRTPVGFESEWHTTSRRQFIFVLSGVVEFETRDGVKRIVRSGELVLAEDTSGEGHITRNAGAEELVMALVTVPSESSAPSDMAREALSR